MSKLFDLIVDPLALPISPLWEWIILAVIGVLACKVAFRAVGDLYDDGIICGGCLGFALHWGIRLVVFAAAWAVTYGVIWLVQKVFEHWVIVLCVIGGLLVATAIVLFVPKHKKHKKEVSS